MIDDPAELTDRSIELPSGHVSQATVIGRRKLHEHISVQRAWRAALAGVEGNRTVNDQEEERVGRSLLFLLPLIVLIDVQVQPRHAHRDHGLFPHLKGVPLSGWEKDFL